MTGLELFTEHWLSWAVWGLVASAGMATLLEGAQLGGLSRMSLPFLFGAFAVKDRRRAIIVGYFLYLAGGWMFALLYALILGEFAPAGLWAFAGDRPRPRALARGVPDRGIPAAPAARASAAGERLRRARTRWRGSSRQAPSD